MPPRVPSIILGIGFLLCSTVIPAGWETPVLPLQRAQYPAHPWIALTFDDGPHAVWTEELLKVLRHEHVPATFFVVGKMADRYPNLIQEMEKDGHEIANHTYTHPRLSRLDNSEVLNELDETRATIRRLTGRDSVLWRPPGGDYTRHMLRATSKAGYKMVLWSVLTNDVVGASRPAIWRRIRQGADDGGIILMHSGVQRSMDMLPDIIALLRERGYHFVTVSTLLGLPDAGYYLPPFDPIFQTETVSADVAHPKAKVQ
jgi:peptidoglycan-N-acetylglucosamine deacetylase